MANRINNECAEASFRVSQIKITDTAETRRLKSFSKQLDHILNMSARMHRSLNHMARDYSHSMTFDSLSSMRVELADISASRNTLEEAVYVSVNALSQPSTQPSPSQLGLAAPADVRTVADILDEDSAAILEGDNELESFTVAATSAELPANLSTGHEKELHDDTDDDAIDAELSDKVSSTATNFLDLCSKLSIAVGNLGTIATKTHTTRLSRSGGNLVKLPNTSLASFSKEGEPSWYNLNRLLLMMDTTSISELLGQQAALLKPRDGKDYLVPSCKTSTRILDLQMMKVMDMGFILAMVRMMMTLYLLFSGSVQGPGNKTL